ncbi:MAG: TRAP transporter substrate-binding protein [Sedimentibacter sp.]|uniref:TRAP transporter substrate-binding protein n=1 Tax=Sedimentibacter sp. TaxID=1960295 RepID=UPI003159953E
MRFKKQTALLLTTIMVLNIVLTGCGTGSTPTETSTGKTSGTSGGMTLEEYALSVATPLSAEDAAINIEAKSSNPDKVIWKHANVTNNQTDSPSVRGDRQFFIELKKILGDKVEIQLFNGGVLGTTADQLLGGLQNRNFESCSYNVGAMAEYTNAFMPLDVMFLIPDLETAFKVVSGEPGELMRQECIKDTGLNVLTMGAIGMRHITNGKRPITSVTDMKGLKIRVQNNPLHLLAFGALGCAPTPIAYAELFTSLQQGVVDGQENPIANIFAQNYVEVQKYMTLTEHLYTAGAFIVNDEWLKEQSPEFQQAVEKAAAIAQEYSGPELQKTEEALLKWITDKGMEVIELSDEAKAEFKEISMSTWDEAAEKIGVDYFNSIRESIEKISN